MWWTVHTDLEQNIIIVNVMLIDCTEVVLLYSVLEILFIIIVPLCNLWYWTVPWAPNSFTGYCAIKELLTCYPADITFLLITWYYLCCWSQLGWWEAVEIRVRSWRFWPLLADIRHWLCGTEHPAEYWTLQVRMICCTESFVSSSFFYFICLCVHHVHVCVCACLHAYMYVYVTVCMISDVHVCVCVFACIHVCVCHCVYDQWCSCVFSTVMWQVYTCV